MKKLSKSGTKVVDRFIPNRKTSRLDIGLSNINDLDE